MNEKKKNKKGRNLDKEWLQHYLLNSKIMHNCKISELMSVTLVLVLQQWSKINLFVFVKKLVR
jgi:hypothetical protein